MKIKKTGSILLMSLLTFMLLAFSGCRKYEQIQVTSASVKSVAMDGLRAVDADLLLGVDNPAGKVVIKEAIGVLKHFGKVIGNVSLAPLTLMPRSQSECLVQARVELAERMGFLELMQYASLEKLMECTIDVSVSGTVGGVAVRREFNEIPLKKLLENNTHEKI